MTSAGEFGQQGTYDDGTDLNVMSFVVRQILGKTRVAIPAKILAVHGGGVGAPPTVDVQVLVNMIDGIGQQTQHGTIFNIPVLRLQGGLNTVIIDPAVGDVGLLIVSDRDISALKSSRGAISNPGSYRRNNLADGVYLGGLLNPSNPNQALQFTSGGVKVFDKNGNVVEMKSDGITITATTVTINGDLNVTGDVTAGHGGGDSVGLQTHEHPTAGMGSPSPPTPGT